MLLALSSLLFDPQPSTPTVTLKAVLTFGSSSEDGRLVEAVALPWFEILRVIQRDPDAAYQVDPRQWEGIIAGAYKSAGFDEVILTPRSGDRGRDVIATRFGVGSIRIFDQVKAYTPGHVVTADEVRAMLGVITGAGNVSKVVVTTTSSFVPRLKDAPYIAPYLAVRLELRAREVLFPWLKELAASDIAEDGAPSGAP